MPPALDTSIYVDDFAMFTCSAHLLASKRRIQLALNLDFNYWSQHHGFKFSPSKTVPMHFTRCRGVLPPPSFRLGTSIIRHVVETKFLELISDSKLYYTAYIKDLCGRCLRSLLDPACTMGAKSTDPPLRVL